MKQEIQRRTQIVMNGVLAAFVLAGLTAALAAADREFARQDLVNQERVVR
jgi:hypothetical protein